MKFAIYGFFFSKEFQSENFSFIPLNNENFYDKYLKVKNLKKLYLTGFIETNKYDENFVFTMRAVLAFVQQQNVELIQVVNEDDKLPDYINSIFERRNGGAPFAYYDDLISEIVTTLYKKLQDFCDPCNLKTKESPFDKEHNFEFSSLVYKTIEPMYSKNNSIEIPFFLYFSGLEAFCKQYIKSKTTYKISSDCAKNIANMLESLEIDYIYKIPDKSKHNIITHVNNEHDFLLLSTSTYANLRNALFHQNIFVAETECSYTKNGCNTKYVKLTEYEHGAVPKVWGSPNYFKFTSEFKSAKI